MARRSTRLVLPVAAALLAAAWMVLIGPTSMGGPMTYGWVDGSSMEPMLHRGDLVLARSADAYAPGDTVVFRVPQGFARSGKLVIHRIVSGSGSDGFVTRGDHYEVSDGWTRTLETCWGSSTSPDLAGPAGPTPCPRSHGRPAVGWRRWLHAGAAHGLIVAEVDRPRCVGVRIQDLTQ